MLPSFPRSRKNAVYMPLTAHAIVLLFRLPLQGLYVWLIRPVGSEAPLLLSGPTVGCLLCRPSIASGLLVPGRTGAESLFDGVQDQVLGLLDAFGGANDLDGILLVIVAGHVDLATALLADGVDLAAALADDVAVGLGVGQDQVARVGVLAGLLDGRGDGSLGLLDVLGRATENPRDVAVLAGGAVHNLPGVDIGGGIVVVGDQGKSTAVAAAGAGLGRHALASVVNGNLVVVAELAEELAVVGDGVVQAAGDLEGLSLLLLDERGNVLLGLLDVLGATGDLDARLAVALAGNVDRDGKLGLELPLSISATAYQGPVLLGGDVQNLGDLALLLGNDLLDPCADLVDNVRTTLDLDRVAISLLLGELNGPGKLATVVGSTSLDNQVTEDWDVNDLTSRTDERLVVLLIHLNGSHNGIVKHISLLLESLLGRRHLRLGTLNLDLDGVGVTAARNVNLGAGRNAKLLQGGTTLSNNRRDLLLLHRDGCRERVVLQVLEERQDLVTSLIRSLLGTADNNFVGFLLTLGLAGVAGSVGVRLVVLGGLAGSREEDQDLVLALQAVRDASSRTDELAVELGVDLEDMRNLVGQGAAEGADVRLGSLGLSLGALELDLSVLNLDLDVEAITELLDVRTALTNEVVGELLREVERHGETTLLLILLLLLDEGDDLVLELLNGGGGTTQSNDGTDRGHTDGDLVIGPVGLLLLDEAAKTLVEPINHLLLGHVNGGRGDLLLLVDDVEDLLARILQALLESTDLVLGGTAGLDLRLGLGAEGPSNTNRTGASGSPASGRMTWTPWWFLMRGLTSLIR
ncbi:hypothetical protein ColTof3_05114 [Colletotrichum tofieldiae]|nr:hypothetical protein ColTof3_05114 [Colletotrichum tofieldiae]